MPDPHSVFKGSPNKQATLKALWPELHAALADDDDRSAKVVLCCFLPCADVPAPERPQAVARIARWGQPGCAAHVKKLADKPGGWPIELKGHRR